jgi:excisionase family DNA binding protein
MGTDYTGRSGAYDQGSPHFLKIFDSNEKLIGGVLPALRAGVTENNGPHRERSMLIPEAADVLGVSRRTVYYRIREGRLQTIRTRGGSQRVLWSSIEALLRSTRPALSDAEAPHADR